MSEEHFHSGDFHMLHDSPEQLREMQPDPESACIECGSEAHNFRCGGCGMPLCSRHAETLAGHCRDCLTGGGE